MHDNQHMQRYRRHGPRQKKKGGTTAPPSQSSNSQQRLRAGMPLSVITEIGARRRVPGFVALRAIARIASALLHDCNLRTSIVVGIVGVIVGPIVIVWVAVIGVGVGRECTSDQRSGCERAGEVVTMEAAAVPVAAAMPVPAAAVPGRAVAGPVSTGADIG